MADVQFWVQVAQYGLSAVLIVAGIRGMYVWRWHYDERVKGLEAQIAEEKQRTADEKERTARAERQAEAMRDIAFEALGVNARLIERVGGVTVPELLPPTPTPPGPR